MKTKKLMFLSGLVLSSVMYLGACDGEETEPSQDAISNGKHELIYAEVLNDGGSDYPREEIKYIDNGKVKTKSVSSSDVYEHILKDDKEKPYVVMDGDLEYHIYRPAYMIYGDDNVEGTVTDKQSINKDNK